MFLMALWTSSLEAETPRRLYFNVSIVSWCLNGCCLFGFLFGVAEDGGSFDAVVDGFGDVDDVVAKLFVEGVEGAVGIADGKVVNAEFEGVEVAFAEDVAVVVDFLFGIVGGLEVDVVVVVADVVVHDVEGALDQLGHVVEVVVEPLVKVDGGVAFVLARYGYLVDDVAYAFEVVDNAEHG